MKVGIVLTSDVRSKAYLQKIVSNEFFLDNIVFMNDNKTEKQLSSDAINQSLKYGFDASKSVIETLTENKLKFQEFDFVNVNNPQLKNYLEKIYNDFIIFTGGGILKNDTLNLKSKFIHFHPGIVPKYRGSTCFYYSIINENMSGVTAFIMDQNLDTGDLIYQKKFTKPNHIFIDDIYDSHIRSETLIDLFKMNLIEKENFKKQSTSKGERRYRAAASLGLDRCRRGSSAGFACYHRRS